MLMRRKELEKRLINDFREQPIIDETLAATEASVMTETAAPDSSGKDDDVTSEDDDEEFCRLLRQLIEDKPENCNDEDADKDSADDGLTGSPVPDGEVYQNGNVCVRVEILPPLASPRKELDKLIGCASIKRRMDELVALTKYNKTMSELFPQGKLHDVSLHSIFMGRPGTGKTTVCKIYGSLLHEAGALSKGHVVVCNRGTFIGTLWGDEERSVSQVLEKARGGVMMIDEAYLLNGKNEFDPGKIVVQMLMETLANEKQRDIAVVLCGYQRQMQKLLDMNPGLRSRFPNMFLFEDFTVEELLQITKSRVEVYDYTFTDNAWEKYRRQLTLAYQARDAETWGNARFVANLLERIYLQHAERCVRENPKDKASWRLITSDDIVTIDVPRQRNRIGF